MSNARNSIFWIPLLMGIASLIFGLALPKFEIQLNSTVVYGSVAAGVALLALAAYLAFRTARDSAGSLPHAGRGGDAKVTGDGSRATGGRAGGAQFGTGGDGGSASVRGNNSSARGGDGGRA